MEESRNRLLRALEEDLGPVVQRYMSDPACEDIALNENGIIHVKRMGEGWQSVGTMSENKALGVFSSLALFNGVPTDSAWPVLETVLPSGNRIEAVLPPITRAPVFSIRLRAHRIYTLADYVRDCIAHINQVRVLRKAVEQGGTILVSGAPGSGKTTLLNALLNELAQLKPHPRVGIVEDAPELQFSGENFVSFLSPLGENRMLRCLQIALRFRFDRLVVGEVRDGAALVMLKAFNTGHPGGLCTLHANDAYSALDRLSSLVQEAAPGYDSGALIAQAIQYVVHIDGRGPSGRTIREVVHLEGIKSTGGWQLCAAD